MSGILDKSIIQEAKNEANLEFLQEQVVLVTSELRDLRAELADTKDALMHEKALNKSISEQCKKYLDHLNKKFPRENLVHKVHTWGHFGPTKPAARDIYMYSNDTLIALIIKTAEKLGILEQLFEETTKELTQMLEEE